MPKILPAKVVMLIAIIPIVAACVDLEDAAIGAAGVVLVDRVMEKKNGDDGLF